jgi:AraC family transcriptional regulator
MVFFAPDSCSLEKTFAEAFRQLQRAIYCIKSHLHEKLELAKIAEVNGFNAAYFFTLFGKNMGVIPHQYILQQRIEYAKLLLQKFYL